MTFPSQDDKLVLAAYLESHSTFTLPSHANNLHQALAHLEVGDADHTPLSQFIKLKHGFNRGVLMLFILAFILGAMIVPSSFLTHASQQINIFWLLISLLGFHFINLIVWGLSLVLASLKRPRHPSFIWLNALSFINTKICRVFRISPNIGNAFWHWQCPKHSQAWLASSLSHGAWGCYLLAGWLMTLLLLLTNQVSFVWETTLLTPDSFLRLTQCLSGPLYWLGVSLPSHTDILISRLDQAVQSDLTRQHWANFLLASLFVYGILPRFALLALSLMNYHLTRLKRPLSSQENIIKARYSVQETHLNQLLDEDTQTPTSHPSVTNDCTTICSSALTGHWGLFEWSALPPEPLAQASHVDVLNDRTQQQAFIAIPTSQLLYVLVNTAQSPDRGSHRFFQSLAQTHPNLKMVMQKNSSDQFSKDWIRLASDLKLSTPQWMIED
ncbi:DUF2868 domain-containing protein [Marinomonas posidonica]|uniref:DUF2868 domain-containing protein n=1 Tax=Marinomonas posidonica (strain CECT 7376 / NCIMB 14433 / IVIA-Po-181) TaxID=491952 RepID=F6CXL3_MARPP|nr:DUF2868 domain-containing protein [Marinomonas posidonica]AEF53326.1 hypothetical protein Mar181_0259 [Marinomonas posidonica IVIA-Po-181]